MPFSSLASESKRFLGAKNRATINLLPPVPPESVSQSRSGSTSHSLVRSGIKIGAAGDQYEQEADRVADQVVSAPHGSRVALASPESGLSSVNPVRRHCAAGPRSATEGNNLHAKASPGHTPTLTPNVATGIRSLKSRGQPLHAASLNYFESRFGHDFSQVRIHVDNSAASMAESIGARAFTLGQDIVFGEDQYQPGSHEGKRLIAHELAHTVQQGGGMGKTPAAVQLSSTRGDRIQKNDDDDDEERRRRRRSSGSGWRFQLGVGPMRAPSPSGPAADFFRPTPQLPVPGLLLNRGLGLQYSEGRFDFGVFPNLGSSTDFYGTRDIPRLFRPGSSGQQTRGTILPPLSIPGQRTLPPGSISPDPATRTPAAETPTPGTGITPQIPLRSLRERTIDNFVLNQSTLPTNAGSQLDSMATWIRLARPAIVWVTGHTDVSGGEQHNQELSEARAASVRQALMDRGIDASVIEASGEGELDPLIPDASNREDHARNRRVTIEWFDAVPPASSFRLQSPWLNP